MKRLIFVLLSLSLALVSCGGGEASSDSEANAPAAGAQAPAVAVEYDAICGHALPEVGKCGNYVAVDGTWVVIEHPDLGAMEWCGDGEEGARIKVAGEMVDGKLVASSYERID